MPWRIRRPSDRREPAGPPRRSLDEVGADLRRLARRVSRTRPGEPMARRRATQAAYDDVLREAAELLGVPACWDEVAGTAREIERLVTEIGVAAAGLGVRA
jgi:hypothetical protein